MLFRIRLSRQFHAKRESDHEPDLGIFCHRRGRVGLAVPHGAFIDGRFVPAQSGKTFPTENPATGKVITQIAACEAADVDLAVRSARKAFEGGAWSRMSPLNRKKLLLKFADLLEANAAELALLDCLEGGKPIGDCVNTDVPETIHCIRWHAETLDKLYDRIAPTGPENLAMIFREPVGVVGAVIPWNFPTQMAAWKLGPALGAGNSVVLKPAEQTSLSALRMGELAVEAGLPPGVLNVVPGLGETAGQAIGRHMDVDMAAFTGSTEVGRYFLRYSAESNLKRVILECGGKSPQVVLADPPDLDIIAQNAVNAAFWNMGENCSCGSRVIVHASVKDALLEKIAALGQDLDGGRSARSGDQGRFDDREAAHGEGAGLHRRRQQRGREARDGRQADPGRDGRIFRGRDDLR